MNYDVIAVPSFKKELKKLSKKYHSLKAELSILFDDLEKNPNLGTPIGKNCYKIRIAITSKGKGKSGGARIITNFIVTDSTVYLLSIYDKSEKENISDKELLELLHEIPE
ncbi:type II toxin-antitoxin system RelE/ParE family toxin [Pedobacter sp. N23S346]|uniref:type II toxin-antitoxin system RelE/ParE family toxin n=1 Tax=Pedobacter sp. N23S346 TaxID=3402750 RepID=UPI003AC80E72